MYDMRKFIDGVENIIKSHNLGETGAFRRWNWQTDSSKRELGINEYGCADAANILYTIGRFPSEPEERAGWIKVLGSLQNSETGMFVESTHNTIHTTAHCIAALELFDAKPLYKLTALEKYKDVDEMYKFLDALDWDGNPWCQSHQGAGLFASMVLNGEVDKSWKDAYFVWLDENACPSTGFFRKGCVESGKTELFPHLAGTFHYLFNMEYEKHPLMYPEKMVDTCLKVFENRMFNFTSSGFAQIDWVFCVTRSLRQCGHRFDECQDALKKFADEYLNFLINSDPDTHDGLNDLHSLFGVSCCVAELQAALPGKVITDVPLKLVLDRRPFI